MTAAPQATQNDSVSPWVGITSFIDKTIATRISAMVEKHFAAIALTFSMLILFFFAPASLIIGSAIGAVSQYYLYPNQQLGTSEKVITSFRATLAIAGAMAALIRCTPAGAFGGPLFRAIPHLASFAIGTLGYRAFCAVKRPRI